MTTAGAAGSFELNVMMPVIARNLLESVRLLSTSHPAARRALRRRDRRRRRPDAALRRVVARRSSPRSTRYIGYEAAAKIAKQALADGATIRETVIAMGYVERGELTEEQLDGPSTWSR